MCATETCPDKGRVGAGNSGIHSRKRRRYRCRTCGDTFTATIGTPYDRLYKGAWLMMEVLIPLAHGCPPQAIVFCFCWAHRSLRLRASGSRMWLERTPAMEPGVTDHVWPLDEALRYPVPPRSRERTVTATPRCGCRRDHGRLLPFPARPTPPPTGRVA